MLLGPRMDDLSEGSLDGAVCEPQESWLGSRGPGLSGLFSFRMHPGEGKNSQSFSC